MWAQAANIIIGLFLMLAPAIWPFDETASNNHYIVGPLVITFAITALWEVNRNVRWFNILAATWLLFSPLILNINGFAASLDVFLAIMIIILSLIKGTITKKYGGGWRSLLEKDPLHLRVTKKEMK